NASGNNSFVTFTETVKRRSFALHLKHDFGIFALVRSAFNKRFVGQDQKLSQSTNGSIERSIGGSLQPIRWIVHDCQRVEQCLHSACGVARSILFTTIDEEPSRTIPKQHRSYSGRTSKLTGFRIDCER